MNYSPIMVVCEGSSEVNYITRLNRIFCYSDSKCMVFKPYNAGGGRYSFVSKKYNEVLAGNRKQESRIKIWVDQDLYVRAGSEENRMYCSRSKLVPRFMFSLMNFEDYLTMHCAEGIVKDWQNTCESRNHFTEPMHANQYEELFNSLIKKYFGVDYKKGDVPFELSQNTFTANLFRNLKNPQFKFKNGFGELLMNMYEKRVIVFK